MSCVDPWCAPSVRRSSSLFALMAGLALAVPATAAPDLGWSEPVEIDQLPLIPPFIGDGAANAVAGDGTRWIVYREQAMSAENAPFKQEYLVFAHQSPADTTWTYIRDDGGPQGFLGTNMQVEPVIQGLSDGRAIAAYRDGGDVLEGGIRILLLDADQAQPIEGPFHSLDDCPVARDPRIAVRGTTALVSWTCDIVDQQRAESVYFDGANWSARVVVPMVSSIPAVVPRALSDEFLAIGTRETYRPADITAEVVFTRFDVVNGWMAEPEVLDERTGFDPLDPPAFAVSLAASGDGSALAVWNGGQTPHFRGLWAVYRSPAGEWSPMHVLASEENTDDDRLARIAAAPGGRYAVVWYSMLLSEFDDLDGEGSRRELLSRNVKGVLRLADGDWTAPVSLYESTPGESVAPDEILPLVPDITVFPNGSLSAIWAEPVEEEGEWRIRSATVPTDASCWREPVTLLEQGRVARGTVQISADPAGGFLASWVRVNSSLVDAGTTLAVFADGPDGSGGGDCLVSSPDTTPEPFGFTAVSGAALGSVVTSNSITVSGIDSSAPIQISGGQYAVNGGGFTDVAGLVVNGDTVVVRLTAAAVGSTSRAATLTVGGVSAQFVVTTTAALDSTGSSSGGGAVDAGLLMLLLMMLGLGSFRAIARPYANRM